MNPFSKQNVLEALDRAIEYDDPVIQSSKSQNKLEDLKDLRQYVINIQQTNPLNYSVNLTQEQFKLIQDYYQ